VIFNKNSFKNINNNQENKIKRNNEIVDTSIPQEIITNNTTINSILTNYSYSNDNDELESKLESSTHKASTVVTINGSTSEKSIFAEKIVAKEENELTQFTKSNLFRRMKIVNDKFIHELVLNCLDHLQIKDDKNRSRKFQSVTIFLTKTINARRNYLKHQILRVMQGKIHVS
jgi:hypothetical protein